VPELRIVVFGTPGPQGSKRHVGGGRMVESSAKVAPWRTDVKTAAEQLVTCQCFEQCGTLNDGYPLTGPLVVRMVFSFVRPKSHYRTGRNAHLLRDGAPARPGGKPDLSKLLRSTEDALTALVWKDDALVVDYERAAKVWVGEDAEALDVPGALIVIRPLVDVALDPVLRLGLPLDPIAASLARGASIADHTGGIA
jgi:Holliday junction resolvase RusA-like endonuclease